MAVYVDNMRARYGRLVMCHMLADSDDELHAMAADIGVARRWHQKAGTPHSHYDICMSKRALAVRRGAVEIDGRKVVDIIRAKRAALVQQPAQAASPIEPISEPEQATQQKPLRGKVATRGYLSLSVRGAIDELSRSRAKGSHYTDESGQPMTRKEALASLMDELAKGHENIPMSSGCGQPCQNSPLCSGFNYGKGGGCPGHPIEKENPQ